MNTLKILTWNIRQGGKKAIRDIVASLIFHNPDLIVLTEYKHNDAGRFLTSVLKQKGWRYVQSSCPPGNENGVLILSKWALNAHGPPLSSQDGSHRWHEVYVPTFQLFLVGVHVPNVGEAYDKRFFWERILQYAEERHHDQAVIVGDFNSVRKDEQKNGSRQYSDFIFKLIKSGWGDAWKQVHRDSVDYSWFSHKHNGFRLDYLFLSPSLSTALTACDFCHAERQKNFSDHSALITELQVKVKD